MAKSVSYAVSSRETNIMMILVEGDTVYDTDFAMFYTLYHIFKQESIQGRGDRLKDNKDLFTGLAWHRQSHQSNPNHVQLAQAKPIQ